jgi:hypothetical protein
MVQQVGFGTNAVAALTGLSRYMIDYLYRSAIVTPAMTRSRGAGRGRARRYSCKDLVLLRTYAGLLERGVSVKRLHDGDRQWRRYFATPRAAAGGLRYLISDGESLRFVAEDAIASELGRRPHGAFVFVVDMDRLRQELKERIAAWPGDDERGFPRARKGARSP